MIFPEHHPELIAGNLRLKKVTLNDLEAMTEIVNYRPNNDLTAAQMIEKVDGNYEEKSAINWGFYLNDELVGTVGFYRGFKDEIAEVGYVTREKFRRKGLTSQAIQTVLDYGMNEMKLSGIVAYTSDWNKASIAVLTKLNFILVDTDHEEYIKFKYQG